MIHAIPLQWFLAVGGILFCLGLFVVVTRKNAVAILMGVELMLNAAGLNLVAFGRHRAVLQTSEEAMRQSMISGQAFTLFVIIIAACEVAVALAILISLYRNFRTIEITEISEMKN